jgi:transposase-like protein
MFDTTKFRKVMDESGLTKAELAKLYGVSRQSLYAWRDTAPRQHTLAERAEKYTAGLLAGMARGLLPFSAGLTVQKRAALLASMAKHLHQLTAPR